jgi:hypothetical protein
VWGGGDSTSWLWGFKSEGDLDQMPIRTRCSPTSTSRGGSERRGESVDQVYHDRVGGLTVIGVRGGLVVRELRVAISRGWLWCSACWLAWCSGTVCTPPAA